MQIAAEATKSQSLPSAALSEFSVTVRQSQFSRYGVIRCNGAVVSFEPSEIPVPPVTKVFPAIDGARGMASAEFQMQGIVVGLGKRLAPRCQTRSAPGSDRRIGLIG